MDGYRSKTDWNMLSAWSIFCFNDEKCFETASRRSYILLFIIVRILLIVYKEHFQCNTMETCKIIYITMTQRTTKCTWKYFRTRKLILILIRRQYDVLWKYKIGFRRKVLVTENNSCKDPSHAWYDFKTRVTKCMKHI